MLFWYSIRSLWQFKLDHLLLLLTANLYLLVINCNINTNCRMFLDIGDNNFKNKYMGNHRAFPHQSTWINIFALIFAGAHKNGDFPSIYCAAPAFLVWNSIIYVALIKKTIYAIINKLCKIWFHVLIVFSMRSRPNQGFKCQIDIMRTEKFIYPGQVYFPHTYDN